MTSRVLRPSSWTLLAKLVASIVLLFVVVTTAVAALTVVQVENTLVSKVDEQLRSSTVALAPPPDADADSAKRPRVARLERGAPAIGGDALRLDIAADGTVITVPEFQPGGGARDNVPSASITKFGQRTQLTATQIAALRAIPSGSPPRTIDLGGSAGKYRVASVRYPTAVSVTNAQGTTTTQMFITTTVGVPLKPVDDTVRGTALAVGLLSGAAILLLGGVTALVVQRNLRPLRRVAATATRVSHLPLSSGDTGTGERVADRDTDARTEVGQVGAALNGLLDHIDRSLTARHRSEMQVRQFVADASHELRTPLTSIKGYAELSRREPAPVPQGVTHALGRIESEADRMTSLVEDLLLLARLDAGRPLDRAPVDLTQLAVESVSDAHAAGPDHVWSLDLPDEPCEIVGDEGRLRQVLINLLANARRHTPAGTQVTTVVRSRPDGGATVTVRDNGPGIPADLLPHVFERFARGDAARTRVEGNTGLGLSIVQAVMSAHGGSVELRSEPGRTEVALHLPGTPTTLTLPPQGDERNAGATT
ncbi:sensor histidine kinase [Luteipulveratus mongoliensis]|nr:ATP-binding protein [Luteipulveratus mongoliensis]